MASKSATYRFEISSTNRAGCQNGACKKAGVKIQKGELRMGSLVTIKDHDTWMWKHWGCVTPVQIQKLQEITEGLDYDDEGDMDVIDGWADLDTESKDKIREAMKCGHVADEDWKGEPELNRPGQKGINKRTPKKKADEEADDATNDDDVASPSRKPATKKSKAKKAKTRDAEDESDEAPPPKKARGKKVKAEDSEAEAPPPKKSRGKKIKVEGDDDGPVLAPAKKANTSRKRKAAAESEHDAVEPEPAPKTKKAKATKKSNKKVKDEDVNEGSTIPVPGPAKSRGRPKKAMRKPKADVETGLQADLEEDQDVIPEAEPHSSPAAGGLDGPSQFDGAGDEHADSIEAQPKKGKKPRKTGRSDEAPVAKKPKQAARKRPTGKPRDL